MMRIHYYFSENDDYFDDYTSGLQFQSLRDRLIWQHHTRKQIELDYQFGDDDFELNLD